jgi:hypothetical protein
MRVSPRLHRNGEARTRGQLVVAAMEGALILARVRRSTRPILDVPKLALL